MARHIRWTLLSLFVGCGGFALSTVGAADLDIHDKVVELVQERVVAKMDVGRGLSMFSRVALRRTRFDVLVTKRTPADHERAVPFEIVESVELLGSEDQLTHKWFRGCYRTDLERLFVYDERLERSVEPGRHSMLGGTPRKSPGGVDPCAP